jgi:hypothetical protein
VFARLFGQFGIQEMTLSLTRQKTLIFAGYPYVYPLDFIEREKNVYPLNPYVVLSPTRGAAGGDGFWVQPFGDGSSGYI